MSQRIYLFCRPSSTVGESKKQNGGTNPEDKVEANENADSLQKESTKKKGKGKKGKKGKGRGKKSNKEVSDEDKVIMGTFLKSLSGSRRLMVRTLKCVIITNLFFSAVCVSHNVLHNGDHTACTELHN